MWLFFFGRKYLKLLWKYSSSSIKKSIIEIGEFSYGSFVYVAIFLQNSNVTFRKQHLRSSFITKVERLLFSPFAIQFQLQKLQLFQIYHAKTNNSTCEKSVQILQGSILPEQL